MQLTVNQRIKFLADKKGFSQYRLAKTIGVTSAAINKIVNGANGVSVDTLTRIVLSIPDVNSYWLLTGYGEPFLNNSNADANTLPTADSTAVRSTIAAINASLLTENQTVTKKKVKKDKYLILTNQLEMSKFSYLTCGKQFQQDHASEIGTKTYQRKTHLRSLV